MLKFLKIVRLIFLSNVNCVKTVFYNFKLFSFNTAYKFPLFIYKKQK